MRDLRQGAPALADRRAAEFGERAKVRILLHPPLLRAMLIGIAVADESSPSLIERLVADLAAVGLENARLSNARLS